MNTHESIRNAKEKNFFLATLLDLDNFVAFPKKLSGSLLNVKTKKKYSIIGCSSPEKWSTGGKIFYNANSYLVK
jgi:hypothetical protein